MPIIRGQKTIDGTAEIIERSWATNIDTPIDSEMADYTISCHREEYVEIDGKRYGAPARDSRPVALGEPDAQGNYPSADPGFLAQFTVSVHEISQMPGNITVGGITLPIRALPLLIREAINAIAAAKTEERLAAAIQAARPPSAPDEA